MTDVVDFQYTTTATLTTSSTSLTAYNIQPTSVSKSGTNTWKVSYNKSDLLQNANRLNSIYKIFCRGTQWTQDNYDAFTQLRVDFCVQPETSSPSLNCPTITDYNNLNTTTCSRLVSLNQDFNNEDLSNYVQCSGLVDYLNVDNTDTSGLKTVVQNGYKKLCSANPTMRECQCYNRATFQAYKDVSSVLSKDSTLQSGNDSCWYIPCLYQTNIMVDPVLQNAYGKVQCPNVCQNILAAVNVGTANISGIKFSNNCGGGSSANNDVINITNNLDKSYSGNLFSNITTKPTSQQPSTSSSSTNIWTPTNIFLLVFFLVLFLIAVIIKLSQKPTMLT